MAIGKSTISGYAFWAAVHSPVIKYQKEGSRSPLDKEYKIDVVVDAADWKAFTKMFKQQKKDPIDREDFIKRFNVEPPEDIQTNGDGEYCIVSFKTNYAREEWKNGKKTGKILLNAKPRVLMKNDETGKLVEITDLVGNGSKVVVQWEEFESAQWKSKSAKLKAVRVDELVAYSAGEDLSELGEVEEGGLMERDYHEEYSEGGSEEASGGEFDSDDVPFEVDDDDNDY